MLLAVKTPNASLQGTIYLAVIHVEIVCEINYRQVWVELPVSICPCINQFGYIAPVKNGTRSFEYACKDTNTIWYEVVPPN